MRTQRKRADAGPVDRWLSIPQAAKALNQSRHGVLAMAIKGELETTQVAGRTVISRASVEAMRNAPAAA